MASGEEGIPEHQTLQCFLQGDYAGLHYDTGLLIFEGFKLIKSFIGLTGGFCLRTQQTGCLLSRVSQYSPGCHLHIRVNSVKPAPGWFLRLGAHWNRPCSSASPLMKTGNPVSASAQPRKNTTRGLKGGTDPSAARWASGGSRPQAARPGRPCAGQTESCVDLATRGLPLDTSRRC